MKLVYYRGATLYGHYEKGPVTLLRQEQETIIQFSMSSDYIVNLQGENFPQFLPLGGVRFENNFSLLLDFYLVRLPNVAVHEKRVGSKIKF